MGGIKALFPWVCDSVRAQVFVFSWIEKWDGRKTGWEQGTPLHSLSDSVILGLQWFWYYRVIRTLGNWLEKGGFAHTKTCKHNFRVSSYQGALCSSQHMSVRCESSLLWPEANQYVCVISVFEVRCREVDRALRQAAYVWYFPDNEASIYRVTLLIRPPSLATMLQCESYY